MAAKKARKKRSPAAQDHPKGPLDTVDEPWKDAVRAVMKERGWNQQDLAGKIPASNGSMTNLFKPGPRQTKFKKRIEELCDLVNSAELAPFFERAAIKFPRLTVEDAATVAALIDSLASKPRNANK